MMKGAQPPVPAATSGRKFHQSEGAIWADWRGQTVVLPWWASKKAATNGPSVLFREKNAYAFPHWKTASMHTQLVTNMPLDFRMHVDKHKSKSSITRRATWLFERWVPGGCSRLRPTKEWAYISQTKTTFLKQPLWVSQSIRMVTRLQRY